FVGVIVIVYILLKNFNFLKHKMILTIDMIKEFFNYSLKLVIGTGADLLLGPFNVNLLTIFSGVIHVGIYSVAYPTAVLALFIGKPFSAVIKPYAATEWAKGNKNKVKEMVYLLYSYLPILIWPVILIFFSFPDIIVRLVFGNQFLSYTTSFFGSIVTLVGLSLRIILTGILFTVFTGINLNVVAAIGKPFSVTKAVYVGAIVNLVFSLVFIPKFGVIGASIALAASLISQFVVSLFYFNKFVGINFPYRRWLKIFVSGAIFLIVLSVLKKVFTIPVIPEMIVTLSICGLVYAAMVFMTGLFNKKEISYLLELTNFKPKKFKIFNRMRK
ncbi:MAG: polysaccharide biosynthesis C-terminal domain-containing protein, partial [Nanoarchaeota archaeon]|nr:polysaccharide biosynthesis C-terminal domain-containing protein [Nanoarchaeota archaeon]